MAISAELPEALLEQMAEELSGVDGVSAVALGGSRARGTHTDASDYDLGIYYTQLRPSIDELSFLAARWAPNSPSIAAPGEWGPWVDGGAWLTVGDSSVDWIFRDVDRVEQHCDRAQAGLFAFHAQPGHPLGFLDVSYAGEVATARPLADPMGLLSEWRKRLEPYPSALRQALIENTWQAEFLLDAADKGTRKADVAFVALCCTHAAMLCAHGWHAYASMWVTNEKDLIPNVGRLPIDSERFAQEVQDVIANVGSTESELRASVDRLRAVVRRTVNHIR